VEMPIKETEKNIPADTLLSLSFEQPAVSDSPALYNLVDLCQPLDLNSRYCYMLIPEHFSATSIVVRSDKQIGGFISAYLVPERRDTLFIWQVAVHPDFRRQGLGAKMIFGILERSICKGVSFLETTVTPSNTSSRKLFYRVAESLQTEITEKILFEGKLFGEGDGHEEEVLFRIGPFSL